MPISKSIKSYRLKNGETRYKFNIRISSTGGTTTRRGFYSIKEAEIAYMNMKNEILTDNFNKSTGQVTFDEVYSKWLKSYKNTVKETTYSKTVDTFDLHIIPFFGAKVFKDIGVQLCQKALNDWVSKLIHYRIVYNYANKIFKEALRLRYINGNPFDQIEIPKKSLHAENTRQKYNHNNFYTIEEQEKFLAAAKKRSFKKYAFFRLLAYTGLRREEILALNWSDLSNGQLNVNKALVYIKDTGQKIQSTKNNDVRTLILDTETIDILNNWKSLQENEVAVLDDDKQIIFNNKFNSYMALSRPRRWQIRINKDIDLDHTVTIHGFRHTHGTLLLDSNPNITPKDLQKRLGHRDLATTMNIYLHATNKSDSKILSALNKINKLEDDQN